jgi:hypothetical protein
MIQVCFFIYLFNMIWVIKVTKKKRLIYGQLEKK